jgi:demethylmenaquinone methyltransferase / 2-methoxy-6-polyprenyl-1,4-benzoquinol methylase
MSPSPLPPHSPLEHYYRDYRHGGDVERSGRSVDGRRQFVIDLFDRTAPHYNWLNRVMSFGSGLRYRREALERAGLTAGMRVLDVAVGTGLTAQAALSVTDGSASVTGVDASFGMLQEARPIGISLVRAVAEELPIATHSFDLVSMGYALRHVLDLKATFREFHRVLRPGGRLVILELTRPPGYGWRYALTRLYLKRFVPLLAQLGPGGSEARTLMEYYWDTIDGCVPPDAVLESLREAGFEGVQRRVLWTVFSEYVAITGGDG